MDDRRGIVRDTGITILDTRTRQGKMTKTCENCQWGKVVRPSGQHGPVALDCHLYPPQAVPSAYAGYSVVWPHVLADDYCSHFQPRVEESSETQT